MTSNIGDKSSESRCIHLRGCACAVAPAAPSVSARERAERVVVEWSASPNGADFAASRNDLVDRIAAALSPDAEGMRRACVNHIQQRADGCDSEKVRRVLIGLAVEVRSLSAQSTQESV